jgi:hypothetical protein
LLLVEQGVLAFRSTGGGGDATDGGCSGPHAGGHGLVGRPRSGAGRPDGIFGDCRQRAADFDNDGFADLAVGVSAEDVGAIGDAGAVNVLYGAAGGLTGAGSQLFTQASPEVAGIAEDGDSFGYALAAGDLDGDGFVDLAIGVPGEDTAINGVGAVNVLYGGVDGLGGAGSQLFTQASPGMVGTAEDGDQFGQALAVGDFDGDGVADLAVGVPGEGLGATSSAGAVNVLYGGADGLSGAGSQLFTQDSPELPDTAEDSDQFGAALAVQ